MTQAGKRSEQVHSCAALHDRASFLAMKLRSLGRDGLAHAAYFGTCAASARACACGQKLWVRPLPVRKFIRAPVNAAVQGDKQS